MSIERCEKHNRSFDTDFFLQCPQCLADEAAAEMQTHKKKPRKQETCYCDAYTFPHRLGGGNCNGCFYCGRAVNIHGECLYCETWGRDDAPKGWNRAKNVHVHSSHCGCLQP